MIKFLLGKTLKSKPIKKIISDGIIQMETLKLKSYFYYFPKRVEFHIESEKNALAGVNA